MWPSLDNPGMAKLLGNPGILEQGGGVCVWPSLDNPGMIRVSRESQDTPTGGGGGELGRTRDDGQSIPGIPGYSDGG